MVPVLSTERLTLRGLTREDTDAVLRVFADPEMSRFFQADFSDPARCREMIDRRLSYDGPPELGHWVLEQDGEVIGLAHLRPSWELPGNVTELGYFIEPRHGGKGLATEAAARLLDYGLVELGVPAVWALIRDANVSSVKLAQRLGFLDVGSEIHYGAEHRVHVKLPDTHGKVHHIELWVPDLAEAEASFGWLLGELGWREFQRWSAGVSWKRGSTYLVVEQSPAMTAREHQRCHPGLNHLALHVATPRQVDRLVEDSGAHGWKPLFADRYPHAGGDQHYAAYLENAHGFEVELVATPPGPHSNG
ncbi:GNAT family N-acetyltransferase [Amycolatopsis magusensis]|uniref:GNAT family N-acetyltransferase n=1 Tax=Amycolatopsis magusensis TaxID=882444 RepID=UPI0024A92CFB|nr:GNAT family N-acetyltransferase [Amycolatopsis magusensis]MDI5981478.1 GNAT family N-acetyltransferase [Amycolatopsis magusensis]